MKCYESLEKWKFCSFLYVYLVIFCILLRFYKNVIKSRFVGVEVKCDLRDVKI